LTGRREERVKNGVIFYKKFSLESNPMEIPKSPKHLGMEARKIWTQINNKWILDDAALVILESALESFDRMREAQQILKREGIVIKDRFGQEKQHPASLIERDAKNSMLRALKSLNLDLEPLNPKPGRPGGK
jgi:P27 family predicted phage terminase small subunit